MPGWHVKVAPDIGQLVFLQAQKVDALASCDLHHRHFVLLGDIGNPAEFGGRDDDDEYSWDDAERAVFLDVGVYAVVDEPRIAFVVVIGAPDNLEQGRQTDLALGVFAPIGQGAEYGRYTPQILTSNSLDELLLTKRNRRHVVVNRRVFGQWRVRGRLEDSRYLGLARTTSSSRLGRFTDLTQ